MAVSSCNPIILQYNSFIAIPHDPIPPARAGAGRFTASVTKETEIFKRSGKENRRSGAEISGLRRTDAYAAQAPHKAGLRSWQRAARMVK